MGTSMNLDSQGSTAELTEVLQALRSPAATRLAIMLKNGDTDSIIAATIEFGGTETGTDVPWGVTGAKVARAVLYVALGDRCDLDGLLDAAKWAGTQRWMVEQHQACGGGSQTIQHGAVPGFSFLNRNEFDLLSSLGPEWIGTGQVGPATSKALQHLISEGSVPHRLWLASTISGPAFDVRKTPKMDRLQWWTWFMLGATAANSTSNILRAAPTPWVFYLIGMVILVITLSVSSLVKGRKGTLDPPDI